MSLKMIGVKGKRNQKCWWYSSVGFLLSANFALRAGAGQYIVAPNDNSRPLRIFSDWQLGTLLHSWRHLPKSVTPGAAIIDGIWIGTLDCCVVEARGYRDRFSRTEKILFECCSAFSARASIGAFWEGWWWIERSHRGWC